MNQHLASSQVMKLSSPGLGRPCLEVMTRASSAFRERKMKTMIVAIGLAMLSGCASSGGASWSSLSAPPECAKINSDQELSLSLADEMINSGKLHAGLANLQRLPDDLPAVRLRKAKIYRLLGQREAEPLYRSLLSGCLAAEGEHGLGQLAAGRGDNEQALVYLQRAARLSPTDEKIRNDLGVVYLNQRRLKEARFEFITAMELKQSDQLAALNLVTLLIYQGNWKQASEVVSRVGLSPGQVTEAKARAEKLRTTAPNDRVATAGDPARPEAPPSTTQR